MRMEKQLLQIAADESEIASGERIFIHLFRPQDSSGIGRLFQAVYGDNYPVRRFYNPEELARAFETGDNYSIVARKEDGEIIGHVAVFRSSPYPKLYESGAGLVLPEYRKAGINMLLLNHAYERLAPELGIEELWGEAVCNHVSMQKALVHHKHVETGIEVDLMPAETYRKEKSSSGRVASLVMFRCYIERPHTVYLPRVHENTLRHFYSALDDRRTLETSRGQPPNGRESDASFEIFEFPRVARVSVTAIGKDFDSFFNRLEHQVFAKDMKVVQVWVSLACPWVEFAVEILRGRGYFIGGILPRWFDDDALLMQKIIGTPDWDGINLYSDRARDILGTVRKDWEEVTAK